MGSSPTFGTNIDLKTLAYILGIAIGDGNLSNPNGRAVRLRITCDKKYPNIIKSIKTALQKIFPKNKIGIVDRINSVDISVYSNRLEALLGWKAKSGSKFMQNISIPAWILSHNDYVRECLRGLIQTDGSIYSDRGYMMVNFTSIIEILAKQVEQIVATLGYKARMYRIIERNPNAQPKYVVRIAKNVEEFINSINLFKD